MIYAVSTEFNSLNEWNTTKENKSIKIYNVLYNLFF